MIKVEELRIGNWVSLNKDLTRETKINPDNFASYWADKFYPIPITEEILLKCGFEQYGMQFRNKVLKFYSGYNDLFNVEVYLMGVEPELPICKIKHLHQLQNLYYALTGEELNIEL